MSPYLSPSLSLASHIRIYIYIYIYKSIYLQAPPLPPTTFVAYLLVSKVGFKLIWYEALDSWRILLADGIPQKQIPLI